MMNQKEFLKQRLITLKISKQKRILDKGFSENILWCYFEDLIKKFCKSITVDLLINEMEHQDLESFFNRHISFYKKNNPKKEIYRKMNKNGIEAIKFNLIHFSKPTKPIGVDDILNFIFLFSQIQSIDKKLKQGYENLYKRRNALSHSNQQNLFNNEINLEELTNYLENTIYSFIQ